MELTREQIQKVAEYLNVKKITFVDVRFEILDHIVSDIEIKMTTNNSSFNEVFKEVATKWNLQFKDTSSVYFGLAFSAPEIIIHKAKKMYVKFYVLLFASYFVPLLLFTNYNFNIQNPSENTLFIIPQTITVFCLVSFLWMFFNKENKTKTTFSFILKTQSLSVFIGLITLIVFLSKPKELKGIHIGMLSSFLFSTYTYFYFYKKHKEAVNIFKAI